VAVSSGLTERAGGPVLRLAFAALAPAACALAVFAFSALPAHGEPGITADHDAVVPAPKPFRWLVGTWSLPADSSPGLDWSRPNGLGSSATRGSSTPHSGAQVQLSVTESGDLLEGALDLISSTGARRSVATFSINRGQPDCPLTWREAGARYQSPMDGSGYAYRVQAGDVARSDQRRHVRFASLRSRTRRPAYPIIIEFAISTDALILRRVQGPQHGAPIDHIFRFPLPAAERGSSGN
jgi:hypothetical protein